MLEQYLKYLLHIGKGRNVVHRITGAGDQVKLLPTEKTAYLYQCLEIFGREHLLAKGGVMRKGASVPHYVKVIFLGQRLDIRQMKANKMLVCGGTVKDLLALHGMLLRLRTNAFSSDDRTLPGVRRRIARSKKRL